MRSHVWALVIVLAATPAFAQEAEESVLQGLGMGAIFAEGNLVVRDLMRGNHPVEQLKRFFEEAKLPLSSPQRRQLNSLVDTHAKTLEASPNEETFRRVNLEYNRKLNEVLTVDQRTTLRRYRTEQIMMRGGFPALRLILENAQTPFTPEQETQVQLIYREFNRQFDRMTSESKGAPDRAELDKLENSSLARVVRLMTPEQRKALTASRQTSLPRARVIP